MKNNIGMTIGIIMAILTGAFFAVFGVFLSVFADVVNEYEILIRIGIVLSIYCFLGLLWGLLLPRFSWKWGLLLGGPGMLILMLLISSGLLTGAKFDYTIIIAILYAVMVLLIPSLGAWGGSIIRKRKRERTEQL